MLVEQDEVEITTPSNKVGGASSDTREGPIRVRVQRSLVLEAAEGRWRIIGQFLDPGPSGEGNTVRNMGVTDKEVLAGLGKGK